MVCVDHSAWYILADDPAHPDEEPHTFALFRMSDAADTGRKFEPGKPFDIEAILQDSLGIHRGGPKATVELLFDPEVAVYVRSTSGTRRNSSASPTMAGCSSQCT
jgi:hypothetical protein